MFDRIRYLLCVVLVFPGFCFLFSAGRADESDQFIYESVAAQAVDEDEQEDDPMMGESVFLPDNFHIHVPIVGGTDQPENDHIKEPDTETGSVNMPGEETESSNTESSNTDSGNTSSIAEKASSSIDYLLPEGWSIKKILGPGASSNKKRLFYKIIKKHRELLCPFHESIESNQQCFDMKNQSYLSPLSGTWAVMYQRRLRSVIEIEDLDIDGTAEIFFSSLFKGSRNDFLPGKVLKAFLKGRQRIKLSPQPDVAVQNKFISALIYYYHPNGPNDPPTQKRREYFPDILAIRTEIKYRKQHGFWSCNEAEKWCEAVKNAYALWPNLSQDIEICGLRFYTEKNPDIKSSAFLKGLGFVPQDKAKTRYLMRFNNEKCGDASAY